MTRRAPGSSPRSTRVSQECPRGCCLPRHARDPSRRPKPTDPPRRERASPSDPTPAQVAQHTRCQAFRLQNSNAKHSRNTYRVVAAWVEPHARGEGKRNQRERKPENNRQEHHHVRDRVKRESILQRCRHPHSRGQPRGGNPQQPSYQENTAHPDQAQSGPSTPNLTPPCRFCTKHGLKDVFTKKPVRILDRAPWSRVSGFVGAVTMPSVHQLNLKPCNRDAAPAQPLSHTLSDSRN